MVPLEGFEDGLTGNVSFLNAERPSLGRGGLFFVPLWYIRRFRLFAQRYGEGVASNRHKLTALNPSIAAGRLQIITEIVKLIGQF